MKILVLCTGNSCRSQMAEGFLRRSMSDQDTIYSAGVKPEPVNQYAVQVMNEIGIDISDHQSNHVNEFLDKSIDLVLTVCDNAKESCPVFPKTVRVLHHNFTDPANAELDEELKLGIYRKTRNDIETYLKQLIPEIIS